MSTGGECKLTPSESVERLAELIAPKKEFNEGQVYEQLLMAGMTHDVADLAYKFTQTAWARFFLDGMGITFSPDYYCFNSKGGLVETGQLVNQPYFAAAMRLAEKYKSSPGYKQLILTSADVNAVNNALNAGSKPENLVTGPAALFMEPPTPEGMEKAKEIILSRAKSPELRPPEIIKEPENAEKKQWWKFW